jgi:hypothetical protein
MFRDKPAISSRYVTLSAALRETKDKPAKYLLDTAERTGKLNLRTQDLRAALPLMSPEALRQSLHRQQRRGRLVHLSRGADRWLIVPLQYSTAGAPPLEVWLDRYMRKALGVPYYITPLSSAEAYGAGRASDTRLLADAAGRN